MKWFIAAVALAALVAVAVLVLSWLRSPAKPGTGSGETRGAETASVPARTVPAGDAPASANPPGPATTLDPGAPDSPAGSGKSDPSYVGRRPYDTGIRNDQRVRTSKDGKHRMMESIQLAGRLHSSEGSAEEDLETLEHILSFYRKSFQNNPLAGDNQMVMEALTGRNPGNLVVFPANHPALDAQGQLLDRWGTPYFFHALSGEEMEIFSAGPDREFNTGDDVQRSYRGDQPLTGAESLPGAEEGTESDGEL